MPLRKKTTKTKYIIWAIIILLAVLMIISFNTQPEFNEVILYP